MPDLGFGILSGTAFEEEIGRTLPSDLVALLLLHNGEEGGDVDRLTTFPHNLRLRSIDEMRDDRAMALRMEGPDTVAFLGMVGVEDRVHVHLGDRYGQTFYAFEMETTPLSSSVLALIEAYAADLESGKYVATVDGSIEAKAGGNPETAMRVP